MAWPTDPLVVTTSIALDAEPNDNPLFASYTDVSEYAFNREGNFSTVITRGRQDESSQAPPSKTVQDMKNTDGRFSPRNPVGAYYPRLQRNKLFRTDVDAGTGPVPRNIAYISELPPRWDPAEVDHHVEIEARGILHRLTQGASALKSAIFRWATGVADTFYFAPTLLEYWPMEEGSDALRFASQNGGKSMRVGTGVRPGSDSTIPGSASLPVISTGGYVSGTVRNYTSTGTVIFECFCVIPSGGLLNGQKLTDALFTGGTFKQCAVRYGTGGSLNVQIFNVAGTVLDETGPIAYAVDGSYLFLSVMLTQNGADLDVALGVFRYRSANDEVVFSDFDDTFTTQTMGRVSEVGFARDKGVDGAAVGHLIFTNVELGAFAVSQVMKGYRGELAGARFLRLLDEENIPTAGVNGEDIDTFAMGPQRPAKLVELLRECEAASQGVLYDFRLGHIGLNLATHRVNQPPRLILDYAAFHVSPPLDPIDDHQRTRNVITVTAVGASSHTIVEDDPDVPLSTVNVGVYDEEHTISLDATNEDLPMHHAGWLVNLGTADGLRFPAVTINFRANPSLVATWLGGTVEVGSRIQITNLPNHISYDEVDLVVEGYQEKFSQHNWSVTLNCAPYKPYQVGVLAEDSMKLLTAEDTTSTAWRIGTETAFTTDSADMPVALRADGELVSVTAAAAVAGNVSAGTPVHADNASVAPTHPSHVEGDLLIVFAAIRNSGTGTVNLPAGYSDLVNFGNVRVFAKYAASGAEAAPTVTFSAGAAGDTTSAVSIRARGCQIGLVDSTTQLNGSAQDIAYPVFVEKGDLIAFGFHWKQDDFTSVAPGSGWTEVVEASTTTGNDQSLYVAYTGTGATTAIAVPAGSQVVTGGAAAISRSVLIVLRKDVVDLTVTRSVNGVVTSHAQLATVQVDQPMNLAL